jgi:hypothetical protein
LALEAGAGAAAAAFLAVCAFAAVIKKQSRAADAYRFIIGLDR